jgi:hypothetical protein
MRWPAANEIEMFEQFAEVIDDLPIGRLAREELLDPRFEIYHDGRVSMYYAPFDFVNETARLVLVGVTPGPTQMRQSFETARDGLRAGHAAEQIWRDVKRQASFKGMRARLARWMDEIGLDAQLQLRSCAELFEPSGLADLHTTSVIRYPAFRQRRDGMLVNYDGRHPSPLDHPMLSAIIAGALVPELNRLADAIVLPIGKANAVIEQLCVQGAIARDRCVLGLPHPSPASPFRERYFQVCRQDLRVQTMRLKHRPASRARAGSAATPSRAGDPDMTGARRPAVMAGTRPSVLIPLTAGNIRNNHIYLRGHLDFFPAAAIGQPAAKDGRGRSLTLHLEGISEPVITDIAGTKLIFRKRAAMKEFFKRNNLREGDVVQITRESQWVYRLTPRREACAPR